MSRNISKLEHVILLKKMNERDNTFLRTAKKRKKKNKKKEKEET